MDVTHLYGLTETFGPIGINEWQSQWDGLDADEQARAARPPGRGQRDRRAAAGGRRDGARRTARRARRSARSWPAGNDVMLGYYRDDDATDGGRPRRLVPHRRPGGAPPRRVRRDPATAPRTSSSPGGENVASVEVERVIDAHPDVVESAVVGVPDERWGEIPVAFVTARPGAELTGERGDRRTCASTWPGSRCPRGCTSASCRRPRPARSRSRCSREASRAMSTGAAHERARSPGSGVTSFGRQPGPDSVEWQMRGGRASRSADAGVDPGRGGRADHRLLDRGQPPDAGEPVRASGSGSAPPRPSA